MIAARRDFGSFHSSNIQELLGAAKTGNYVPPSLPFDLPQFSYENGKIPPFGQDMRKKHFLLEEATTFINHGAFGSTLKDALDVAQKWQVYIEQQPLRFYDRELFPHLVFVTKRLAEFVDYFCCISDCSPTDLVLIPNVTMAMNCVIKSQVLKQGDTVFMLNVTYGAVKKLLKQVCDERGVALQEESLEFPLFGPNQIITKLKESLQPGTKLAVFDHIPSNASFINPLPEIIDICHQRGTKVLIDGAHTLGIMDLKLSSLGADYYTSNCHKWLCSPKGCAFLYVKPELQNCLQPLVISHGFGFGFSSEYIWTGLKDYSAFLALHTVLDFWESLGLQRVRGYIKDLMSQAVDLLVNRWKTGLLAPKEMFGSMACVQLPEYLLKDGYANYEQAEIIQNALYSQNNIEVPVKALGGKLYVRISVHIYNELEQYQKLADAVEELTLE
ncbi:probable L-cysteine desulfhydrase, chloroplastic isoform X6 [Chiloscyllium plagiosum]|uniref:probable L-cysteine desulfhydrase, chloroplastic isoform X6 n=1 Tax=Chiloscyllium plagiosum TaxID=36176 RepID=UPI001CB7F4DC|nr:probable L-cysteine desulfhydrase, chloroplastic isoform X6 [Chiloscyllium plagiosum]